MEITGKHFVSLSIGVWLIYVEKWAAEILAGIHTTLNFCYYFV